LQSTPYPFHRGSLVVGTAAAYDTRKAPLQQDRHDSANNIGQPRASIKAKILDSPPFSAEPRAKRSPALRSLPSLPVISLPIRLREPAPPQLTKRCINPKLEMNRRLPYDSVIVGKPGPRRRLAGGSRSAHYRGALLHLNQVIGLEHAIVSHGRVNSGFNSTQLATLQHSVATFHIIDAKRRILRSAGTELLRPPPPKRCLA